MEEERQPPPDHLENLQQYFGHLNFKPKQWEIIRSIMEDGQDNCVVMASGYGKSLIYQYPSVVLGGLTIVISPLISLMEDQVRWLKWKNIPSCFLGSAQLYDLTSEIVGGKYRIVYLTPEYVTSEPGLLLLNDVSNQLNLIAIDEAYCIIKWGPPFRPAFGELWKIRETIPNVPILAVTAVATPSDRQNIAVKLRLRNAQIWCTGIDRPNLEFHVKIKSNNIWTDLEEYLNNESSIIIYCRSRNKTDEVAAYLSNNGIVCEAYHPDIGLEKRSEVWESFMDNRVKIIVATEAFGMGIDKPDVRLIIHYGAPMDLETYYLEVGQAGRDGEQSNCIMFWDKGDFISNTMRQYLNTREDSRTRFIQLYFEGINPV